MLDRKGELLDLQELAISEQAIQIDGQRVRCQLAVQARAQTPKTMRMICLDTQMFGQLPVDRFNDLPSSIQQVCDSGG